MKIKTMNFYNNIAIFAEISQFYLKRKINDNKCHPVRFIGDQTHRDVTLVDVIRGCVVQKHVNAATTPRPRPAPQAVYFMGADYVLCSVLEAKLRYSKSSYGWSSQSAVL